MGEADQAKHCFAPPNAEARRAQAGPERSEGEPSTNGLSQTARPLIRGWWAVMGEADQAKHCFAPPNAEARRAQAGPERSEGEPSTNGLSQTARPLIRGWWAVMDSNHRPTSRSEERRVGKGWGSTCKIRGSAVT